MWLLLGFVAIANFWHVNCHHGDPHGGVPMGISNVDCDNADWNIERDIEDYSCTLQDRTLPDTSENFYIEECIKRAQLPEPLHVCMNKEIVYSDLPPMGGPHRPLWPVYGEYYFLPPQRWVHSLEHGAFVFLYHPCADERQVEIIRRLAEQCLDKYIITPYLHLKEEMPFAVISYGHRLLMTNFDVELAKQFMTDHARMAPESHNIGNGQYTAGLLKPSTREDTVTNINRCPVEPRAQDLCADS